MSFHVLGELAGSSHLLSLKATPPMPSSHPVFDKVADKIGALPRADAYGVSRLYNVATSVRVMIASTSSDAFHAASEEYQSEFLHDIAKVMKREAPLGRALVGRLDKVAGQSFWGFVLGRSA